MAEGVWKDIDWGTEDESKGLPTMEEYRERVKYAFWDGWTNLPESEIEGFMDSEFGQECLTEDYERAKRDYESGAITRNVFLNGCAAATGMNLELGY